MNDAPNESSCVHNSHVMPLQGAASVSLVPQRGEAVLAPEFGGESKSCHRAVCASELMNSLLTAPLEKILSSSVSALGGHGDRGQGFML